MPSTPTKTRSRQPGSGAPVSRRRGPGDGPARPASSKSRPGAVAAAEGAVRPLASEAIQRTVEGLGYDLIDLERLPRGLLRVSIDRVPEHVYPTGPSEFLLVEDCELVTRQLQSVMEVEQIDYERLEVSSPGLDRPLRKPADWVRFSGFEIDLTLKMPFQGRRKYRGVLHASAPASTQGDGTIGKAPEAAGADATDEAATPTGWSLCWTEGKAEQILGFTLDEVREARLVPVIDFKGRRKAPTGEQKQ